MRDLKPGIAVKLLPSLADLAFLLPVGFLFGRMNGARSLLGDGDTGWHIRTGEWILANGRVPTHDLFSYSRPGEPWFAWEWLSEVLLAGLDRAGGLQAVLLFSVLLLGAVFAALFYVVRAKSNPVIAILVTLVAAVASSVHWLARPHLFTLLFTVLFYAALERVREGRTRLAGIPYLVLLPVTTVLWTNLHGGFIVGVLMTAAYGVGEALRAAFGTDPVISRDARRAAIRYLASAAGCALASIINPYGYHLHEHVLWYLADPYQATHIVEFLSLSFRHPVAIFFEVMLLAGAFAAFWYGSRRSYIEPVLLLMWGHAALLATRNIPLFVIIAAPPVAAAMNHWIAQFVESDHAEWLLNVVRGFQRIAAGSAETDYLPRWHMVTVAGCLAVAALLYAPAPPVKFRAEYDPQAYPAAAVDLFRDDASARIFTSDVWGGYLIYRLYPRIRVFVDGRSDFYGPAFSQKFIDVWKVKYDWEQTLSRFGVNTILLPIDAPLAGALKESSRWRVVYDDGVALVFRPQAGAVRETISATIQGGGKSRDREVTKTQARDRAITEPQPKT